MSDAQPRSRRGVVSAVGWIGAATLASRVLGYVRDMVVARAFGAGPVTDAFFVAFRIPNLLRRLLAEGALSTAVVPVFTRDAHPQSGEAFGRLARAVTGAAIVVLCVVRRPACSPPARRDGDGAGLAHRPAALRPRGGPHARRCFPYLLLVGLAALATGTLNAHRRFFTAAFGPAVLNVAMIAGGAPARAPASSRPSWRSRSASWWGARSAARAAPRAAPARRAPAPLRRVAPSRGRRIARRLSPAVFALAAVQITVVVNTLLASLLPTGTISYLYYADRVMEFPLGVFGIALATASLPHDVRPGRTGRRCRARSTRWSSRCASPPSWRFPRRRASCALGGPIVAVLFQRGEFRAAAAAPTAQALAGYAVGLPAFSATRIAAQTFYALGDTRTPVLLGLLAVAANVVLALVLMWPLRIGLALASSLSSYVNLSRSVGCSAGG